MNRSVVVRVIGLILLACCAALVVLPARWVIKALPDTWPLAVVDASGTVWSGTATMALGTPERRRSVPEPIRWQLSLSGGPKVVVNHPWLGGPLTLAPAWLGLGVSGQTLQLPASALSALDARIAAVGPGGELTLKWPPIVIGRTPPTGTTLLDAQWRNAVSSLTPIRPLGDYALALKQGEQGRVNLDLSTRQGPLMLSGAGALDRSKGFQFDGTAHVDPAAGDGVHAALSDLLAVLGPRRDNQTILRFR